MGDLLVNQSPFRTGDRLFCQSRHTQPGVAEGSSDARQALRRLGRLLQSKYRIPVCPSLGSRTARPTSRLGDRVLAYNGSAASEKVAGENVSTCEQISRR